MKQYIYIILCTILLIGCAKESFDSNGTVGDGKTIETTFTLAPEFVEEITVRSVSGVDERVISDVWVIQLSQDGTSQLQAPQYITTGLTAGASDCKVTVSLKCSPSKIYFITNTNSSTAYKDADTEDKVKAVTMSITVDENLASATSIPMSGMWKGTPDLLGIAERVLLSRAVAKVNFNLNASLPKGETFILQSVTVKQIPNKLNYYRDASTLDTYPYPVAPTVINYLTTTYSDEIVTVIPKAMGWYLPENARGTVTTVTTQTDKAAKAPNLSTYIEIAGQYILRNGLGYATTYRIYLGANNTTDYNVKRNTHYNVNTTIRGIDAADTRINIKEILLDYTDNGKGWFVIAPVNTQNPSNENAMINWFIANGKYDAVSNPDTLRACPIGWRMPTRYELIMIWIYKNSTPELSKVTNIYWSADESSVNNLNAWQTNMSIGGLTHWATILKTDSKNVRCVKDVTSSVQYPYAASNRLGETRIIVSRDEAGGVNSQAIHENWSNPPANHLHSDNKTNSVPARFEIAKSDCDSINVSTIAHTKNTYIWENAVLACAAYAEDGAPAGSWRLPTQRELMLLLVMHNNGALGGVSLTGAYWSCTSATTDTRWIIKQVDGGVDNNGKNALYNVRCVRDVVQ